MYLAIDALAIRGNKIWFVGTTSPDKVEPLLLAQEAHAEVGQSAAEAGLDLLLTVGEHAESTAEAARKAGMEVVVCENVAATGTALRERAKPGDVVLLKASRATRLEQVEDSFRDKQ